MDPTSAHSTGQLVTTMRRNAFTLVELMVVILIIMILVGLILAGMSLLGKSADAVMTIQRIEAITAGLQSLGKDKLSSGQVLLRQAISPTLVASGKPGGVLDMVYTQQGGLHVSQGSWLDSTHPPCLPFPWGSQGIDDNGATVPMASRTLADFSPAASVALLQLASSETTSAAWLGDRGPEKAFNDAWGNPLIVSFAVFQPAMPAVMQRSFDTWQHSLSVYITVGSAGPILTQPLVGAIPADTASLWTQITTICEAATWNESSLLNPPWQGVKRGKSGRSRSFLSAPIEIR